MFKEENGKISFSRLTAFMITIFYLIWANYIVFTSKTIPDIPVGLLTLILGLYGINKISNSVRKR